VKDQYEGFARAISIHRTSFSTVIQIRPDVPEEVYHWSLSCTFNAAFAYIPFFFLNGTSVAQNPGSKRLESHWLLNCSSWPPALNCEKNGVS
jgi:dipeptidase